MSKEPTEREKQMTELAKEYLMLGYKSGIVEKNLKVLRKQILELFEAENKDRKAKGQEPIKSFGIDDFTKRIGKKDVKFENNAITYTNPTVQTKVSNWGEAALKIIIEYYGLNKESLDTQIDFFEEQLSSILSKNKISKEELEKIETETDSKKMAEKLTELFKSLPKAEEAQVRNLLKYNIMLKNIKEAEKPIELAIKTSTKSAYISARKRKGE